MGRRRQQSFGSWSLQFDIDADPRRQRLHHLFEQGNRFTVARIQVFQVLDAVAGHPTAAVGRPIHRRVVNHREPRIHRVHIEFHRVDAAGEGAAKSLHRVFRGKPRGTSVSNDQEFAVEAHGRPESPGACFRVAEGVAALAMLEAILFPAGLQCERR